MPNNTTVNKVIINGVTRLDLTGDTATPSDVAQGKTFHDASGALQTGTASGGGGDSWSWMGKNPTKIATCADDKVYLKDTSFATWTPSTTEKSIKSVTTLTAQTIDLTSYDYRIWIYFHGHFEYNEGTSGTAMATDTYQTMYYYIVSYPSNLSNITADTTNTATHSSSTMRGGIFYKNTSGVDTYTVSTTQGMYIKNPGSLSVNMTKVTPKGPSISVKCSSTYLSTTNCELVNQNTSYYEIRVELWRVDKYTIPESVAYSAIRDMWVNGF